MYGNSPFTAPASLRALEGGSAGRLHLLLVGLTHTALTPCGLTHTAHTPRGLTHTPRGLTHQSLFVACGFGAVLPGGVVAAVTSHPFDTVKTRLQAGAPLASAANPAVLWRGLLSPVLVVPPGG